MAALEPQSCYTLYDYKPLLQRAEWNSNKNFKIRRNGNITVTLEETQSYMNNASELPNERVIEVTNWTVRVEHTTRKNITLRVLPAST